MKFRVFEKILNNKNLLEVRQKRKIVFRDNNFDPDLNIIENLIVYRGVEYEHKKSNKSLAEECYCL